MERSTLTDTTLQLPEQLDRHLYVQVAKVLKAAGGKWIKSAELHRFTEDPRAALGLALRTGVMVDQKIVRQAFYTPDEIADVVARIARVNGFGVLEPSAGDGALARACLKCGATSVECIEIEPKCLKPLTELKQAADRIYGNEVEITIADFLQVRPHQVYKRIVMNPPFTRGQWILHIRQAMKWLLPTGSLYCITPDQESPKLENLTPETEHRFHAGAFKESGTMIATRLIRIDAE